VLATLTTNGLLLGGNTNTAYELLAPVDPTTHAVLASIACVNDLSFLGSNDRETPLFKLGTAEQLVAPMVNMGGGPDATLLAQDGAKKQRTG
jgi:hypothetical protein